MDLYNFYKTFYITFYITLILYKIDLYNIYKTILSKIDPIKNVNKNHNSTYNTSIHLLHYITK